VETVPGWVTVVGSGSEVATDASVVAGAVVEVTVVCGTVVGGIVGRTVVGGIVGRTVVGGIVVGASVAGASVRGGSVSAGRVSDGRVSDGRVSDGRVGDGRVPTLGSPVPRPGGAVTPGGRVTDGAPPPEHAAANIAAAMDSTSTRTTRIVHVWCASPTARGV